MIHWALPKLKTGVHQNARGYLQAAYLSRCWSLEHVKDTRRPTEQRRPNGRRAKASRRPFSEEDARRPEKHMARRPTPSASGAGPTETTTTGPLVAEGWPPPKTKQRTEMMRARVCRSDTPHSAGGNVRRGRWVPKRRKGLRSQDLRKRNENAATRHSCTVFPAARKRKPPQGFARGPETHVQGNVTQTVSETTRQHGHTRTSPRSVALSDRPRNAVILVEQAHSYRQEPGGHRGGGRAAGPMA